MYLYHFGFTELPFGLTPDTSFFCKLPGHVEALNVLKIALGSGEGFMKISGEVGTGKTLLCRQLLNELEDTFACAYLPNPYLSPGELRFSLASELGMRVNKNLDQIQLTERISRRLINLHKKGKPVVLIIDEAQALPDESLEALRLFTNLETEKRKLLQVVLFGQPELDERLAKTHLRQLRQRITFSYKLPALNLKQTQAYIQHRINAARIHSDETCPLQPIRFSSYAIKKIFKYSRGIPRLINILTHKSLMLAYGEQRFEISARQVRLSARDTDDVTNRFWPKIFTLPLAMLLGVGILLPVMGM